MPNGFPAFGIGPLAPARISQKSIDFQGESFGVDAEVHDFVLYDLDQFVYSNVKVNPITSKVSLVLRWDGQIRATIANYLLKSFAKQRGLTVNLRGDGTADMVLQGLRIDANIKYSLGIISGKPSIKDLKIKISLAECESDITGLLGNGFLNHKLNEFICEFILMGINDNQDQITKTIEDKLKPIINGFLSKSALKQLLDEDSESKL